MLFESPIHPIPPVSPSVVPNLFHFVFGLHKQREPFHLVHYLAIESCFQINRPERIDLHLYHEPHGPYWELARRRVNLREIAPVPLVSNFRYGFRNRGCKRYAYAHHADFIRLQALLAEGGVYADIDTLFVQPLPARLFAHDCVLGREDDVVDQRTGELRASLCNAFIMAQSGSPFVRLWLAGMQDAFDGTWSNHSTFLPQRLAQQHPHLLHVEPSRSFYPFMWTIADLHTLFEGCERNLEGAFSIHLWSHLWWEKRRRDFSSFHGDLITEKHIRTVDTTYNLIARRFLP
jgi:hypothetical protein